MAADLDALVGGGLAPGTERATGIAERMTTQMRRMSPFFRSLTGEGVRQTLEVIAESVPVHLRRVASGTAACDWVVPDEWTVRAAHIQDAEGRRVVDIRDSNLHLVGYSHPVRATMTLEELRPHLHTLPEHPDWIPYRTSYYHRDWGFCLTQRQLDAMDEGPYDVLIDTTLEPGELTYGEVILEGESDEEVLISSHVCHPSLVNDNLTGIAVATQLAGVLAALPKRRFTYRFLFAPGTIGALTWLSRNSEVLPRVRHGLVITGVGGPGPLVYKRTRRGDREIDRAAEHVVSRRHGELRDYSPWGYDERQFNSSGFDLPVGRLTRTPHGEYPEYHTSADDFSLISDARLLESLQALVCIVDVLERDGHHRNLQPYGEPQLGRRGLYPKVGGRSADETVMAMLWTLALTDADTSLLDIAQRADTDFSVIRKAADRLIRAGVLERIAAAG